MFEIFRKKRIARYTQGAKGYVAGTYKPASPKQEYRLMFSIDDSGPGVRYSAREEVHYSRESRQAIPAQGDKFRKNTVQQLFSQFSPDHRSLNSKLDGILNLTFVDMLARYINMKGWRDSKVYKAAHIDRRLFSKIMSDREYKPAKDTALALAIALELTWQQTRDFLDRAGYTLSHSNKRDVIIEYFICEGVHDLGDINEVLFKLNQKTIGR